MFFTVLGVASALKIGLPLLLASRTGGDDGGWDIWSGMHIKVNRYSRIDSVVFDDKMDKVII